MAASAKPNNSIPAPRADTNRASDWWEHIADISSGDIDLRQRQYGGNHAPQIIRLVNKTAGNLNAVLIQERGAALGDSQTISVLAGSEYVVRRPIRKIVASGSGALEADVFWWFASNTFPNP